MDGRAKSGRVLHVQRMSTEDGPGIRTTVFFKGCSLACDWCHNPESISPEPQTVWNREGCLGCESCVDACPNGAVSVSPTSMVIDRARCVACGTCADECPAAVMEVLGTDWELDKLVDKVSRDRAYFEQSGGGITVSGGEPAMQASFVGAFLQACQQQGLHTVLDTCGMCSKSKLLSLAAHVDLVLYDLKLADSEAHRRHTGQPNERILANAEILARFVDSGRVSDGIWIRTPLIPGITATEENVASLAAFIDRRLGAAVRRWELCAFNNLCANKYERLGLDWAYAGQPLLSRDQLDALEQIARDAGVETAVVTGASRLERGGSNGAS